MAEDTSLLRIMGIENLSERIFMFVLHRGRATAQEICERFDLPESEVHERLESLRDMGLLARRSDGEGFAPVDPRYSLRAIADRLNDSVRRLQDQTPVLAERFDRGLASQAESPKTQVLTDPDAVAGLYARLQHQVVREFMAFDRPPYVTASMDPLQAGSLDRGVSWRAIYAASSFEVPGAWEEVEELASQGEQSRVIADLPLKLAIADRSIALLSLSHENGHIETLVTESQPLVNALCDLFEFYWERSLRMPKNRSFEEPSSEESGADTLSLVKPTAQEKLWNASSVRPPTHEEQALLTLIGAGLKDDVIARQLGMSPRTLRRRSQDLMTELGADNRFQAGVEASRRGWV